MSAANHALNALARKLSSKAMNAMKTRIVGKGQASSSSHATASSSPPVALRMQSALSQTGALGSDSLPISFAQEQATLQPTQSTRQNLGLKAARRIDIFASLRDRYKQQTSFRAGDSSSAKPFDIEATENERLTASVLELLDHHDDALSGNYGYPILRRSQQDILDDALRLGSRFSSSSEDEVYDGLKTEQDEDGSMLRPDDGNKKTMKSDKAEAKYNGPETEQDEIEHMLSLMDKHNKTLTTKDRTRPEYTMEHYLLNNEIARERLVGSMTNPGAEHLEQRRRLRTLIGEAILHGDHAQAHELKQTERRHEEDIFEEYSDSALLPLREAMSKAEGDALRDIRDIQILYEADLALLVEKETTISPLDRVRAAQTVQEDTVTAVNDSITALDSGHAGVASHLLDGAHRSSRRSTTRFCRLGGADVPAPARREEVLDQRARDPHLGTFISKAVVEMGDAQSMVDSAKLSVQKMQEELIEIEQELKSVEDELYIALLAHVATSSKNASAAQESEKRRPGDTGFKRDDW